MASKSVSTKLRFPTKKENMELLSLFAAHFIGGLLPLWGSWLLIPLVMESASFSEFIRRGEFLLYAAALLPSAAFLVLRDLSTPYPHRLPLGLFVIFLLVVSSLVYAAVFIRTKHDHPDHSASIDVGFLAWISLPLYIASLILMLVTTFFDMIILSYSPAEEQKQEANDLANQFRNLRE